MALDDGDFCTPQIPEHKPLVVVEAAAPAGWTPEQVTSVPTEDGDLVHLMGESSGVADAG